MSVARSCSCVRVAAIILTMFPAVVAEAQRPAGAVYESYRRAAVVIREGVAAHGGEQSLRGLRGATVSWTAQQLLRTQGRVPAQLHAPRPDSLPSEQRVWIDLQRTRARRSLDASLPGGYRNRNQLVVNGRELMSWDAGHIFSGTALFRDTLGVAATTQFNQMQETMPALLVRMALVRISTARWVGLGTANGRKTRVVTFTTSDGRQMALHFDVTRKLLVRFEILGDNAIMGDVTSSTTFLDYDTTRAMPVPRRMRAALNDQVTVESRLVDAQFDAPFPDSLLTRPEGYTTAPPPPAPGARKVGEHVWFIEGVNGYRSMFVDTDEGIVVLEAPLASPVTEQMIAIINRTLPDRPIRYVALSHHHEDHVGGLRSYIARGVTVLVAPGLEPIVREIASSTHTSIPADSLARAPRAPIIQTIVGRRTIGTGARAIELIDASPTSHAAGMLLAWVPSEKILFQGDFIRLNDVGPVLPAIEVTRELGRAIERLGLDVKTIGSVHGRNGTIEELREAISKQ